jgi:hypothetical protein
VNVTDEIKAGAQFSIVWDSGRDSDNTAAYEVIVRPETAAFIRLLWKVGEPVTTYFKKTGPVRYRFRVPAYEWRRVSRFIQNLPEDRPGLWFSDYP